MPVNNQYKKNLGLIFLILLFQFHERFRAQTMADHPIVLTSLIKPKFDFNEKEFRDEFRKKYDGKFLFQSLQDEFEDCVVSDLKSLYFGNYVFSNMDSECRYIENVLRQSIPEQYLDNVVKIKIIRDPEPNAFCLENGVIGINIGWIAMIDNESELSAMLTHEFAHYFLKHGIQVFKSYKRMQFFNYLTSALFLNQLPFYIHLQRRKSFEKQADMFGLQFLEKNKFSPKGFYSDFEKFRKYESIRKKRKDHQLYFSIYSTHPSTKRRIRYLKKKTSLMPERPAFRVDSITFTKLRKRCIDESMYFYYEKGDYRRAIELSYKEHLKFPEDKFYFFILFESTRRLLICEPLANKELFITRDFKIKTSFKDRKNEDLLSITNHLKDIYGFTDTEIQNLPNKSLTDTTNIKFRTNLEAFEYFKVLALKTFKDDYFTLKRLRMDYIFPNDTIVTEFSKSLFDQTFAYEGDQTYSKSKMNYPFFLNNIYSSEGLRRKYSCVAVMDSSIIKEEYNKLFYNKSEEDKAEILKFYQFSPNLNYRELCSMPFLLDAISKKVVKENFQSTNKLRKAYFYKSKHEELTCKLDPYINFPELDYIARKYHYQKIFFIDFLETNPNSILLNPAFFKSKLNVLFYCVDFENNRITRKFKRLNFKFKDRHEYNVLFPELMEYVKNTVYKMNDE